MDISLYYYLQIVLFVNNKFSILKRILIDLELRYRITFLIQLESTSMRQLQSQGMESNKQIDTV